MGTRGSFRPAPFGANQGLAGKVSAILDLSASAQSGGEWTNWVDLLNDNPGVINAARRPAVTASGNGLPTATFATNDCVSVPLVAAINNQVTKCGWAFHLKVGNIAATSTLITIGTGTLGASAQKLRLLILASEALRADCFISGANGRLFTTTAVLTQNATTWVRLEYDSSRGGDANIKVFFDTVDQAGSFSDSGAGGTLTTLPVVTGNMLIGNINDDPTPSAPLAGIVGPRIYCLRENLTLAEDTALMNFDRAVP